jgi:hypothetical protein
MGVDQVGLHAAVHHLPVLEHLRQVQDRRAGHGVGLQQVAPLLGRAFEHPAGDHRHQLVAVLDARSLVT